MMISFCRIAIALLLVAVLSGCSSFRNKEPEYLASRDEAPLKIPPGLDNPMGPSPVLITVPEMRLPAGDELDPAPPRVVSTAGKQDANAHIAWSAQGAYLMVKDAPDSVARRLGFAIVNSGMTMLQKSPSGSHKFHYKQPRPVSDEGFFSRMAFWRSRPDFVDFSGTFMTSLKPDGEDTRVYLLFGTGEAVDTAGSEHILGIFMERLG
jgi:hypothetical protein